MGRTKNKSRTKNNTKTIATGATAPVVPAEAPTVDAVIAQVQALLVQAATSIAHQEYPSARSTCSTAIDLCQTIQAEGDLAAGQLLRDAFEILGTVEVELGEVQVARQHFLSSLSLSKTLPNPSPAPHLYLAQLSSPQDSLQHFNQALEIIQAKLVKLETPRPEATTDEDVEEERSELKRSASKALVGMTELYLTDLCFESDAEARCEQYLAQAAQIDSTDPEVFQTLASVRLSQQRPLDASEAATQSWSLWRNLDAESPSYPPSSSRLALAQLLLELQRFSDALEVLQRLEMEDDEDPEVWYLSGWSWWLLGSSREEGANKGDGAVGTIEGEEAVESKEECWSEARLCMENYLKLDERDPAGSDPEQLKHVKELLAQLIQSGIVASAGQEEEGNEWVDDDDDDAMEE
ncbi:BZ3500_MvSof-1268-A1-R1_Chr1-3g01953 [Microbotryum saponariae]|uniref:BZ3500_MvSof-1268-A1-R1_Chr1-3g01953 protein n=1 Tax=Microbotryum saponariae TaxID=289078 RepID=A0A2X0KC05_9BASI|nr:BZ3500_MvSof-1268-A1-R1_Chr1-3g01953 [Microbotryum saponariae]SCZ94997.1 BZ3501_MvSof-1269-A2-R1_Chr1-3g01555 [Microbotryum saponariae]